MSGNEPPGPVFVWLSSLHNARFAANKMVKSDQSASPSSLNTRGRSKFQPAAAVSKGNSKKRPSSAALCRQVRNECRCPAQFFPSESWKWSARDPLLRKVLQRLVHECNRSRPCPVESPSSETTFHDIVESPRSPPTYAAPFLQSMGRLDYWRFQ